MKHFISRVKNKFFSVQGGKEAIDDKTIKSYVFDELKGVLNGQKISMVDVGGAVNLQPHHHKLIGNTNFFIFEPDERSYRDLVKSVNRYSHPNDFHYINKALSGKDGKRTLYLSNAPTGTSILKLKADQKFFSKDSTYFYPMREVEIETYSLETVLNQNKVETFDAIKLDVQGAELEIIKSIDAKRLENVNAIELEICLHDVYENQTQFCDVLSFMNSKGFSLFDLRNNKGHFPDSYDNFSYQKEYFNTHDQSPSVSARVWEFDAIFFRDPNWVKENSVSNERLRKIAAMYCVYNFFGEAIQIIKSAYNEGKLSEKEFNDIKQFIINWNKKEQGVTLNFDNTLKKDDYQTWAQYMWVPYPSN